LSEGPLADRPGPVLSRAIAHLISLQRADGAWEGEVVWCTMILSQYVIVRHITARPLDEAERRDILRHYQVTRTAEGGWPLHPEGSPLVFTTTLAYIAVRLIGTPADHELTRRARHWLHAQPGGVLAIPTWGKFWLSLLDLYGSNGVAALPPEVFLLPSGAPGHPNGWYCHTRYIYLAMSYLSGRQFSIQPAALRDDLRHELYEQSYDAIDFSAHADDVSPTDLYARPAAALRLAQRVAPAVRRLVPVAWRQRAQQHALARIVAEQRGSRYQALSPVNGLLNCLALHATDPLHPDLEPSLAGLEAWRWQDEERGIRYAGARSQVWDTAFAARALLAIHDALRFGDSPRRWGQSPTSGTVPDVRGQSLTFGELPAASVLAALRGAHTYLKESQLVDDLPAGAAEDRDPIRGGWCFSDGAHRWPVSDCTAEALTAALEIERLYIASVRLPEERVQHALAFILARQNADGGFSTYERQRAGAWLDRLNPSEMFRDCMTERSYVECTASAIEAIVTVRRVHPRLVGRDVARALERALSFLRGSQRADGTFPAAWGIHLTYSIFHVVKAACAAGISPTDPMLARAAVWLRSTQRHDGGWGEHFSGCLEDRYVEHSTSQAVMTSWALLALAEIEPDCQAIRVGLDWLESRQEPDGSWPREAVNGVFFGTAMLDYSLYVSYFPTWAAARCAACGREVEHRNSHDNP
jgi:squalene cyclase